MLNLFLGFCLGGFVTGLGALWLFDHTDWNSEE